MVTQMERSEDKMTDTSPKLFVSYSWTSPEHESWVLDLATELRQSGVDVILDKWDLKEGQDAYAFMEKMVSDETIGKVIMICDRAYAEKADRRSSGVGTEAQIISGEIYAKQDQSKFVAVIREMDDNGEPCLPIYYKSRIYIDLSETSSYAENFERLLRWIYDRPLYKKPDLGQKPVFLTDGQGSLSMATTTQFRRAVDGVKNDRGYADAAVDEYFTAVVSEFEKLRISCNGEDYDEAVIESITSFQPYRNEVIELFLTLARYRDNDETRRTLHRFFESLIPFMHGHSEGSGTSHEWDSDNFKFLIHELFLYAISAFLKLERFDAAANLMEGEYYIEGMSDYGKNTLVTFTGAFRHYLKSFEHRNKRLNLRQLSLRASILKQRCGGCGMEFRELIQTDFTLFIRSCLDKEGLDRYWWPETLVYAEYRPSAFEMFARCRSLSYFNKVKVLFGISSKEELLPVLDYFDAHADQLPRWEMRLPNPRLLLGYDLMASRP
jgi:hypothetical protein